MTWIIDPSHTQATFAVRHMMISNVRGRFEHIDGTVEFDPNDLSSLKADIRIEAASINTRDEKRDAHLRSADFLDVENHPYMSFKSTGVKVIDDENLELAGDLTIRGVTRPVVFKTEFSGVVKAPWGSTNAGFAAHTKINRKDWDLVWNVALETGGLLVGDEVKIDIEIELTEQVVVEEQKSEEVPA